MISSNNKISLLVNSQFPDFVQEDYPLFVSFLEAYYEFLENKINIDSFIAEQNQTIFTTKNPYTPETIDVYQNGTKLSPSIDFIATNGTTIVLSTPASSGDIIIVQARNDLYTRAKELVNIKDVDQSLIDFQNEFFNTYLYLFPKNTDASKYTLIKNAAELYKSKGNENSFKYFFRTLFNEEIEILTPRNNVLVASGGKFVIPKVLRTTKNVYSLHSGGQKEYIIALPKLDFPQDPFDGEDYVIFGETYEWNELEKKWTNTSVKPIREKISVYVDDVLKSGSVGDPWSLTDLEKTNSILKFDFTGLGVDAFPRGAFFKSDGTQLYLNGDATNRIIQISFSDAWNLSSFSTTTKVSNSLQLIEADGVIRTITSSSGIDFKPDGTRLYFLWITDGFNRVLEYNLSEAWNVATASPTAGAFYNPVQGRITAGVSSPLTTQITPIDVKFKSDGTRMFITQNANDTIDEFSLSTAWQVNTASYLRSVTTNSMRPSTVPQLINPRGFAFKGDGTKIFISNYINNSTPATIFQIGLSEAWNVQSYNYESHLTPVDPGYAGYDLMTIKPDGNRFYFGTWFAGTNQNDSLHEFKTTTFGEYSLDRERNRIVFPSAVESESNVKVYYEDFDYSLLNNRRIEGANSGAKAIIESSISYTNFKTDIFEYTLNEKSIFRSFLGNENYKSTVLAEDETIINMVLEPYSEIIRINLTNGGSSYNVGDPITIIGGDPITPAKANVSRVFSGVLNQANVIYGGAGFTQGFPVFVTTSPGTACVAISTVDTSGKLSPNSYTYSDDMIWDLSSSVISLSDYKTNNCFLKAKTGITPNLNARLVDCFNYKTITGLGPISETIVLSSTVTTSESPILNAASSNVRVNSYSDITASRRFWQLIDMGSVGRIDINSPGTNYSIGDGIKIFYPEPGQLGYDPFRTHLKGRGARAFVANVNLSGGITEVQLCPPQPSANVFNGSGTLRLGPLSSTPTTGDLGYFFTGSQGTDFINEFSNGRGGMLTFTIGWDLSNTKLTKNEFPIATQTSVDGATPEIRGLFTSNTGNRLFLMGDNNDRIAQVDLSENWNVASFNSQSIRTFTIPTASFLGSGSYSGMKFSDDGTRIYITDISRPNVVQFSLTQAWNVQTATYFQNSNVRVGSVLSSTRDMAFSTDGLKMYVIGVGTTAQGGRIIHEYNLSTAWRVNTATYLRSTTQLGDVTDPSGLYFHSGGKILFVVDRGTDNVYHYNLTEAWNIATLSAETLETFTTSTGQTTFITKKPYPANRVKVFVNGDELLPAEVDTSSGTQIILTNPLSAGQSVKLTRNTANPSFTQVIDMPNLLGTNKSESDPTFINFANNGSRMYYGGFQRDAVYEIDINSIPQSVFVDVISSSRIEVPTSLSLGKFYIPNTLISYSENFYIESQQGLNITDIIDNISYNRTRTYDLVKLKDNKNYFCSRVSIKSGNNYIEGYNTNFRDDFRVGDQIIVYGQKRTVHTVFSDATMNVTEGFSVTKSNTREIGIYNIDSLGGDGYRMTNLPFAEVDTLTDSFSSTSSVGSGAQLKVTSIMSDGENISMSSSKKLGEIEEIEIIDGGTGYSFAPELFFTSIGDGTATATATLEEAFASYAGTYLNSDGHLSSDKRLQDRIYYNTGSYVIKTKQHFEKFKNSLLNLIHPAGKYLYSEYAPEETLIQSGTENLSITTTVTQVTV